MITIEQLKSLFTYNPITGIFTWNYGITYAITQNEKGYVLIRIHHKYYRAHRLAWLYMTGDWPKGQIDHDNNIKNDNRWENLREANNQLNHYNLLKPKNNTSGAKGVRKVKNGKFQARIKHNQKEIYLGLYETLELASEAYLNKAKELANEFANAG